MPAWYVDKNASGANNGTSKADAYTTLEAALLAKAAGDTFWVSHLHVPTALASLLSLTSPGTPAAPCYVWSVNFAGSTPPVEADLLAGAVIATTAANSITFSGHARCRGIKFIAGSGASAASINLKGTVSNNWIFDDCDLELGGTSGSSGIQIGVGLASCLLEWNNTRVKFAGAISGIVSNGAFKLLWRDTPNAITVSGGGVAPNNLFLNGAAHQQGEVEARDVDLSPMGAGKNIVGALSGNWTFNFDRCKTDPLVTKSVGPTSVGTVATFKDCGGAEVNHTFEKFDYMGSQTTETTITRTGTEATDGTTPVSMKIVTTANSKQTKPFVSTPTSRPNTVEDTPVTVDVYGVRSAGGLPTNAEIWMEVEYLSGSGSSLGAKVTTGCATLLSTPVAYPSGGAWSGGASPFKMSATFTPNQKGSISVRVYVAAASSTFYIDPMPFITGQPITKSWAA